MRAITKGLAVVCVGFDAETPSLKAAAFSLARRTGVALRFVHVIEANAGASYVLDTPLYGVSAILIQEAMDELRKEREKSMRELLADIPPEVEVESALLTGDAPGSIIYDAEAHGASLIMTACSLDHYSKFIPKGFSVALRLMAEAPLPVLVSSRAYKLDFLKPRMNLLVADDLQPSTEEAVRKTFELANHLTPCRIRQVHVHGDIRDMLHSTWLDMKKKHPALQKAGESPEDVLKAEFEGRVAALQNRGGHYRSLAIARGITAEVDVCVGKVADNLNIAIEDVDPDLVVFGRHRALKAKPYLIGRMGYRTMLEAKRPVLVIPPHEQLYAPLPFPGRGF